MIYREHAEGILITSFKCDGKTNFLGNDNQKILFELESKNEESTIE